MKKKIKIIFECDSCGYRIQDGLLENITNKEMDEINRKGLCNEKDEITQHGLCKKCLLNSVEKQVKKYVKEKYGEEKAREIKWV